MIMGPPAESVESQHSYCTNDVNGVSTTKMKYSTQIYMFDQNVYRLRQRGLTKNQNESINNMIWSKCAKSRFVISVCETNEMREHMEKSHFWNH